jgi:hypothetical protein
VQRELLTSSPRGGRDLPRRPLKVYPTNGLGDLRFNRYQLQSREEVQRCLRNDPVSALGFRFI